MSVLVLLGCNMAPRAFCHINSLTCTSSRALRSLFWEFCQLTFRLLSPVEVTNVDVDFGSGCTWGAKDVLPDLC